MLPRGLASDCPVERAAAGSRPGNSPPIRAGRYGKTHGVGPITALAVETFAPSKDSFKCGRDFAAWLGLVPLQKSTGGKQRLGRASKMGQHDIRHLLIIGAMSVVQRTLRKGAAEGSWLAWLLAKKPRMLVAIALANKMARGIWAMMTKNEDYRGGNSSLIGQASPPD